MKKQKIISICLLIFICLSFASCNQDDEVVTEVRYTVYDNGGDMISIYMTSDTETAGVWEYSIENDSVFEVFLENEELNEYGRFGLGGTASYKTLILKPISEGQTEIVFSLSDDSAVYVWRLKSEKDSSGVYKIKVEEIK